MLLHSLLCFLFWSCLSGGSVVPWLFKSTQYHLPKQIYCLQKHFRAIILHERCAISPRTGFTTKKRVLKATHLGAGVFADISVVRWHCRFVPSLLFPIHCCIWVLPPIVFGDKTVKGRWKSCYLYSCLGFGTIRLKLQFAIFLVVNRASAGDGERFACCWMVRSFCLYARSCYTNSCVQ